MHDLKSLRDQIDALRDGMRRREKLDQLGPLIDRAEVLDRDFPASCGKRLHSTLIQSCNLTPVVILRELCCCLSKFRCHLDSGLIAILRFLCKCPQ